jgi:hypothetical protein
VPALKRPGASEQWTLYVGPSPRAPWTWELSLTYDRFDVKAGIKKWVGYAETRDLALSAGMRKMDLAVIDPPSAAEVLK